jgi:hypothetical protein
MKLFAIQAILVFTVLPAFADSFDIFALQPPDGFILMDPTGNPLLRETHPDFGFNVLAFQVTLPAASTSMMAYTISLAGQPLPPLQFLRYVCAPQGTSCVTDVVAIMPYMPTETNWILRVDLNGQSETFNFRYFTTTVLKPVPEPTLITLFGTGLATIGWRKFKARSSA